MYCDLTCSSGETYVKFVKKCGSSWANEESFKVYDGSTLLYTGANFANRETRTIEQCLTSSVNNQFTVELIDSYGDSWYTGSYLTILGKSGNVVFKNMMTDDNQDSFPFSLYYGIEQDSTWKMTSGVASAGWTEYSFSDSTWTDVTLGSETTVESGTQYFRKQFVGLSDMAAYDVRLYYKAGVIAYINGIEVYRDNLPDGAVSSTTAATGEYTEIAYRGFIRPGSEVALQQSILAVELHFNSTQTIVDFNAYLAILATSTTEGNCFIYAESTYVTSNGGSSVTNIFDFVKSSYYQASSSSLPATVTYSFEGPRPYINSLRVWPYTSITSAPSTFSWQGSNDNSQWTTVFTVSDTTYETKVYQIFGGYFYASLYPHYRLNIVSSSGTNYVYAYEVQPLICSTSIPTSITFTPDSYTFLARFEMVYIQPDISEFTSCSAQNLPEGLSIDSVTCVISGVTNTAVSDLTITVTSVMNNNTYTGSFTLNIQECSGTVLNILRTYGSNAAKESFEIKDTSTQQTIISVAANSGQVSNEDWTHVVCVTGSKYVVTVGSENSYWSAASFLYVRAVLYGDEMETILRMRYDINVGFPSSRTFNAQYSILPHSNWYYKHGEVPTDWYSSTSTTGWTEGNTSNFPDSTNQIQLYKKTFTVADINNIAGFVLSIKYKYGCIVYLNGHEAFRKGLTDATISTSSYADNIYTDTLFHQISLPIKTVQVGETTAVNYIQQGSNTIAIGLVAANANQKEAIFDGAIRLMGDTTTSRVFDYTVTYSGLDGDVSECFEQYYAYEVEPSSYTTNYLNIAFNNDRQEWINSVTIKAYYRQISAQPREFVLKARSGNDAWTTLTTVTELTWSQVGQAQIIYFQNNKAYNEYRFENIATGDFLQEYWKFNTLDMSSVYTTMTIPELVYDDITIFKDIEMGEVYPNSPYYYNFQISPSLPAGISLDPNTGMISGTATAPKISTTYTITASKLSGGTSSVSFSLSVEVCTGSQSLITLVARTDSYPGEGSYKVYQGIGTSGTVVASIDSFITGSGLNYGDFCLDNDIYTIQLLDSGGDGWFNPAGYYLTVDMGAMIFEMGQLPANTHSVSTMFSSYLPFQIEYTEWKVNYDWVENWNTVDFDDSDWESKKASLIGTNSKITTYIRKEVNIPDIGNYHVLNIRVKYTGGVVAYFNGFKVARFNMGEIFDSETMSFTLHDEKVFSMFHIIMTNVAGRTGKNMMAFEIHRPMDQSSSNPVVFDATGVFGVNECSIVVDTYSSIDGSEVDMCSIEKLFDLNPTTYGYQENVMGTYLEWAVENLEGTKFNSFAMQTVYSRSEYGFSLYGRRNTFDDYITAVETVDQTTQALRRNAWPAPVGTIGFKQLRFEVDVAASSIVYVSSYMLQYCKVSGSGSCPGVDEYPPVGEGEISPGSCEKGYRGYSYRTCSNGQLGEIDYRHCIQLEPKNLAYEHNEYNLTLDIAISIAPPAYENVIEEFYLAENNRLPLGLTLNPISGEIVGTPVMDIGKSNCTIFGKNQVGIVSTTLLFNVQRGRCEEDGHFPMTYVGKVAVYECASDGLYIGTQKRACKLGEKGGEWQRTSGFCISIIFLIVLVVVVVVIIVVIALILVCVKRSKKQQNTKRKSVSKKGSVKKDMNV